jgi:hypothetical protein
MTSLFHRHHRRIIFSAHPSSITNHNPLAINIYNSKIHNLHPPPPHISSHAVHATGPAMRQGAAECMGPHCVRRGWLELRAKIILAGHIP